MLRNLDGEYHSRLRDGKGYTVVSPDDANAEATGTTTDTMGGIFDRVGSFVERTSSWSFSDMSNIITTTSGNKEKRQIHRLATTLTRIVHGSSPILRRYGELFFGLGGGGPAVDV